MPFPTQAERRYVAMLRDRTERMHRFTMARLRPALERVTTAIDQTAAPVRTDSTADEIGALYTLIRDLRVEWGKISGPAQLELDLGDLAADVSANNRAGLANQIKSVLGIAPLIDDRGLAEQIALFRHANVDLIQTVDTKYFNELGGIVQRGLTAGTRPETMAEQIAERYEVSQSRAKLIARDQISKLHGQVNRTRQQNLGIESYIWRTAGDERVRPTHAERDGNTYRYDDPPGDPNDPGDGANPGDGIQCRCEASPDLQSLLDRLESEAGLEPME